MTSPLKPQDTRKAIRKAKLAQIVQELSPTARAELLHMIRQMHALLTSQHKTIKTQRTLLRQLRPQIYSNAPRTFPN